MVSKTNKYRAVILAALALAAPAAVTTAAPIALDKTVAGPVPTTNALLTQSIDNFTVADNPDRLLVVTLGGEFNGTTAAVTYGTQAMTRAADAVGGSSSSIWYLLSPNVGTANITATITTAGNGWTLGAGSFYNVAQQAPSDIDSVFLASATTSTLAITVPSDGLIVESVVSNALASPIVANSGQTSFYNVNTTSSGGWSALGSYDLSFTANPSSQQVTIPSTQRLAHVAVAFAAVPEPTGLLPVALVTAGLLGRRRKRGTRRGEQA